MAAVVFCSRLSIFTGSLLLSGLRLDNLNVLSVFVSKAERNIQVNRRNFSCFQFREGSAEALIRRGKNMPPFNCTLSKCIISAKH